METVTHFILGGSKITADEIKRRLLLGRKAMTNTRQHIKRQRNYFADKGPYSQSCGFQVVLHGWERWTIRKAESWRTDVFELWCWRRILRVPWTARRSNPQSILKEISPEYSLEGLMLKLTHSMLWPPDAKYWLTGKDPDAGKDWRWEEKETTEDGMVG